MVVRAGEGAFLAKADIRQAYRMVMVHPRDHPLLGMVRDGSFFVDSALPFKLCSAPKIFNAIGDALEWLVRQECKEEVLHYLDHFLIIVSSQGECEEVLSTLC